MTQALQHTHIKFDRAHNIECCTFRLYDWLFVSILRLDLGCHVAPRSWHDWAGWVSHTVSHCHCITGYLKLYPNGRLSYLSKIWLDSTLRSGNGEGKIWKLWAVNRPNVAGAVLQTPLSFINSLIQSLVLFGNIFKTPPLPNHMS